MNKDYDKSNEILDSAVDYMNDNVKNAYSELDMLGADTDLVSISEDDVKRAREELKLLGVENNSLYEFNNEVTYFDDQDYKKSA